MLFPPERTFPALTLQGRAISFDAPVLMAIVNVTPDSFYDGGVHLDVDRALAFAHAAVRSGASIVDVGGESTRPGAPPVPADEEIRRILPIIHELASAGLIVSVDTTKAAVADAALSAGACMVNDISGGLMDPEILAVASDHGAAMILQHLRGTPATMQRDIRFDDVVEDVSRELVLRKEAAVAAGVDARRILVDPGIGFGKTPQQCIQLLSAGRRIASACGSPVLVGPSNKSFIGHLTGAEVQDRLAGTVAACLLARTAGAHAFRVHDVAGIAQAFTIAKAFADATNPG
ncbi:dihydropteroate synthase [Myxococcota bacterium]|nr:dihydropteroate synthase [Myxococcota bacterium]MBU1413705.1 dihydropteroate synthase [Myxococcota bacterium]MBU1511623.1 dihydropteroate synthase [Myxococcota bacterium]